MLTLPFSAPLAIPMLIATMAVVAVAAVVAGALLLLAHRRREQRFTIGGVPQKRGRCRGCAREFPFSGLVYVNHCYHQHAIGRSRVTHTHTDCAGFRELCVACHNAMPAAERDAYYARRVREQSAAYPVEESLLGLRSLGTAGELGDAGSGTSARSERELVHA